MICSRTNLFILYYLGYRISEWDDPSDINETETAKSNNTNNLFIKNGSIINPTVNEIGDFAKLCR